MESLEAQGPDSGYVSGMTNEQLAHELMIDPNFTLDENVRLFTP
jgi:hypothetical protein